MRFKKINLLLFVSLLLSAYAYSQKKLTLDKIYTAKTTVDVMMPIMLDSTNLKKQKFEYKDLLASQVDLPEQEDFTEEIRAEVMREYFFFRKAQNKPQFRFFNFQINTGRYGKLNLKIASPSMFELYINGKKEISKTSIQDSISSAKVAEKLFTSLPGTNDIVIKYLSLPTNKAPEGIKVTVETQGKDSVTDFNISYEGKRNVTIEDMLSGKRAINSHISPNGDYILSHIKDVSTKGKTTYYYELTDVKTLKSIRINTAKAGWMKSVNKYYYTNKEGNDTQLICVDPTTFESVIMAENISSNFRLTADDKSLIYTEKEDNDTRKGDLKLLASPEDRQTGYYSRNFIYRQDVKTGLKERLTFGKKTTYLVDISQDSRYLLYSTYNETPTEPPFKNLSMFRLNMETHAVDTLWIGEPYAYDAIFSPDGKKILITGSPQAFDNIGLNTTKGETPNSYDNQCFIMDLSTKQIEPVTKNFNPSVISTYWNKMDNMIYLRVTDKDYENIYRYDPAKKTFSKLNLAEDVIQSFSLSSNSLTASYHGQSLSNSTKVYTLDLKNEKSTLINNPLKENFRYLNLGEVKDWNFTASDGTVIEGRYYLPPNFDSSKQYPMIVYYYGGTTPTVRAFDLPYPAHVYSSLGYVVYILQPSGTIGYGQDFSARHVNAWGKRTADDIIEGTKKFTDSHSFVNKDKVGCMGASYGGFMTMYLLTQTDIFAAAMSHAGISSISSYWGEGYWGYTYSTAASSGSYPWNNKELYVGQSPLFNADKIHTPLLLIHGTADTNVPIGESIQMYTALKILGRPVEFIEVKKENHGVADYNRRIKWNYSIYAWFAKWLQDDPSWWDSLYSENK
ncbi:MAG: prolyl oligopeptidase family serine peptidase [Dysgonomonas sp.]